MGCIVSYLPAGIRRWLLRKRRPSQKLEDGDAGTFNTVSEETQLLREKHKDASNTTTTSEASKKSEDVTVKVEESGKKPIEPVAVKETVITEVSTGYPASKGQTEKVGGGADVTTTGGKSSGYEDIAIEDDYEEGDGVEALIKRTDAGLDTTEIKKIRQSGDFRNVSMTVEDAEQEEAEDEEEEEEEDSEEEEEDNNNAGVNYDEDIESSDYEEINQDIIDKHMEDSKSDNELNEAAIKIQAGFRGYKARKNLRERKEGSRGGSRTGTDDEHVEPVQIRINPLRTETEGDEDEGSGSEIIPIPVPRRRPGSQKIRDSAKYRSGMVFQDDTSDNDNPSSEEILGLDNEYLNKAATRIQANVRGWMTRKQVEKDRNVAHDKKEAATKIQATVRGFLTRRRLAKARNANRRRSSHGNSLLGNRRRSSLKPDVAATRIQAVFRGYHVRKTKPKKKMSLDGGVVVGGGDAGGINVSEQD